MDGRGKDIGNFHGAVIAQQRHPGAKSTRHHSREIPGRRYKSDAIALVGFNCRCRRSNTLAAQQSGRSFSCRMEQDRYIAARTIEMRFDQLEHKAAGNRGIERITAPLQNAHRHS